MTICRACCTQETKPRSSSGGALSTRGGVGIHVPLVGRSQSYNVILQLVVGAIPCYIILYFLLFDVQNDLPVKYMT